MAKSRRIGDVILSHIFTRTMHTYIHAYLSTYMIIHAYVCMPVFVCMRAMSAGTCYRLCCARRWVELDEHTGILVIWTQRPPKGLVYKIEVRSEKCSL